MKFSLVLATIQRTEELKRFLHHLDKQTYKDFELVVVDQNDDNRLEPILSAYKDRFPVIHIRSEKGLSRARNAGLKHISGDIIAFPDDDCWYPTDLLEKIQNWFLSCAEYSGFTCKIIDEKGQSSVLRWASESSIITKKNIWLTVTASTIFISKTVLDSIVGFDEQLGVGSGTPWASAEEIDFVLRALHAGHSFYYDHELFIYHPNPIIEYNQQSFQRAYSYNRGMGRVLKIHHYPFLNVMYKMFRPLAGTILSLMTFRFNKARFHWATFRGRLRGWYES